MSASRYDHPILRPTATSPARRTDAAPVPTVPRRRSHSWRTAVAVVMAAAIVCLAALLYATGGAPFGPTVSFDGLNSRYAMLIDADSGEAIASRDADARMYPASLTKVMTAVVVLDHADELDAVVEAPADMFPALWEQNASMAGLQPGESATVEDMLYGLMLPSGADCAIALARYVAGDVEAFVELMNRTAAALGMSGTHFTNPTGLHDADHYSTAQDMTTLFAHAMRNGTFRTIAGSPSHTMSSASLHDGDLTVASTVFEELGTPLVAGGWIVAGKTGYTPEAGLCLATAARFGGRTYILFTAGAPGDHATSQADVDDARYVYGQIPGL